MDEENKNDDLIDEPIETPPVEEPVDPPTNDSLKASILTSIKKLLGIAEACEDFDDDIIIHINTVFMILNQLGVGKKVFAIEDKSSTWNDFLEDDENLEAIKTYIHLKVRLIFDPPLSTAVKEAIENSIRELEWRINVQAESK